MVTIHSRLVREHGYRGSYSSVKRFVHRLRPNEPSVCVRIETPPGREAQVDAALPAHDLPRAGIELEREVLGVAREQALVEQLVDVAGEFGLREVLQQAVGAEPVMAESKHAGTAAAEEHVDNMADAEALLDACDAGEDLLGGDGCLGEVKQAPNPPLVG